MTAGRGLAVTCAAICGDIKLAHSVFALPFAALGLLVGTDGHLPGARLALLALLAMVLARSGAMAWNRWTDRRFDATNPRTSGRALPAGRVPPGAMLAFAVTCAVGFVAVAAAINPLCGLLAPVALALLFGYSFAKRVTSASHLVLGTALALSPPAAYVAARGAIDAGIVPVLWISAAVIGWVAGFDIIYSCQDVDHDRREGLHSLPARIGVPRALVLARLAHVGMLACLATALRLASLQFPGLGLLSWTALVLVAALLAVEHALVAGGDLARVNAAFFTVNGVVSLVFAGLVATDLLVP